VPASYKFIDENAVEHLVPHREPTCCNLQEEHLASTETYRETIK